MFIKHNNIIEITLTPYRNSLIKMTIAILSLFASLSVYAFTLTPTLSSTTTNAFALDSLAGYTMALTIDTTDSATVPAEHLPIDAIVMQSYLADGTLTFNGFGKNAINSKGTYTYSKISSNIAIEETLQISEQLPQPYTYKMIYVFESENSGRWYQNFGNGLVYFSGNFKSIPSK